MNRFAAIALLVSSPTAQAGFEGVDYWVGEGAYRSALVIDWVEAEGEGLSLAWGYRWDTPPTGEDMLRAVLAEDERLVAKLHSYGEGLGAAVYGLGYDFTGDGELALSDGTAFPGGVASPQDSAPSDVLAVLAATAVDPGDVYAEGLLTAGFWHYTLAEDPGSGDPTWTSSGTGASSRILTDGDWDGWTFAPYQWPDGTPKSYPDEYFLSSPDTPHAAPSPTEPGDFNRDGFVDAADYAGWRETEHQTPAVPGAGADGDFTGVVDTQDLNLWRTHYGQGSAAVSLPEPTAGLLTLTCFLSISSFFRRD